MFSTPFYDVLNYFHFTRAVIWQQKVINYKEWRTIFHIELSFQFQQQKLNKVEFLSIFQIEKSLTFTVKVDLYKISFCANFHDFIIIKNPTCHYYQFSVKQCYIYQIFISFTKIIYFNNIIISVYNACMLSFTN